MKKLDSTYQTGPLPDDCAEVFRGAGIAFIATTNDDETPNLSPKGTFKVLDAQQLVFGDVASPVTLHNVAQRPDVEVNVIDPLTRSGYRIVGTGRISNDPALLAHVLDGLDHDYGVTETVKIAVAGWRPIRSPRYDLYDATAEDTIRMWSSHYARRTRELLDLDAQLAGYVDAWNAHDIDAIAARHTDDTEFISPSFGRHARGKRELRDALAQVFSVWPDLRFDVRWKHLTADRFVTESTATATQHAALTFGVDTVEPTGVPISFDFVDIFELTDGLVRSKRTYFDPVAYMHAARSVTAH